GVAPRPLLHAGDEERIDGQRAREGRLRGSERLPALERGAAVGRRHRVGHAPRRMLDGGATQRLNHADDIAIATTIIDRIGPFDDGWMARCGDGTTKHGDGSRAWAAPLLSTIALFSPIHESYS